MTTQKLMFSLYIIACIVRGVIDPYTGLQPYVARKSDLEVSEALRRQHISQNKSNRDNVLCVSSSQCPKFQLSSLIKTNKKHTFWQRSKSGIHISLIKYFVNSEPLIVHQCLGRKQYWVHFYSVCLFDKTMTIQTIGLFV